MIINAQNLYYKELNQKIREASDKDIVIENCLGQRYIGDGQGNKNITIYGTPGNDLGAYLTDAL